jgi:negative regulator of sigma E activity
MKKVFVVCVLALSLVFVGYGFKAEAAKGMTKKQEVASQEKTITDKDTFVKQMEQKVADFEKNLLKLDEKAANATEDVKAKVNEQIVKLGEEVNNLKYKIEEVKAANDFEWQKLQNGVNQAYDKLQKNYEKAVGLLK